ncbi:MAG: ATP-binding protein, partial [Oscillospiraceae bacterium]|nr:ATP-binding protein [Oscillospiraceae bacterium]
MAYEDSSTWKRTLGSTDSGMTENESACVERLRASYRNTRDRAGQLAESISKTLPFFTQHDISHIDALWDSADLLLGNDYPLNPAEGYVLGLSFLLHDLGMALAAYQEGPDGIRDNAFFRDALASEFLQEQGRTIREADWTALEQDLFRLDGTGPAFLNRALAATLRELHTEKAETLAFQCWTDGKQQMYLIDDSDLREAFGELAGKIAASHGWSYDRLKASFPDAPQGVTGVFPQKWEVDARKLACVLRGADAIQIDDRRAPSFLMALRRLEGASKQHWVFQNRLNQPTVQEAHLFFTSKSAFPLDQMEAWWLCYDTLRMADRELQNADTLLMETGRTPFRVRGVYGLSSAKELSRYIQVKGWIPMDTTIRVGNVASLVAKLGGAQLYGKDSELVPFRELIQNGADAVRARRMLEERGDDYGDVVISMDERDGKHWISFSDNGIGMSEQVLTGPFLDFGQTFWNTSLMNRELPGLSARGFRSTGQYGIGFYSVFIWSEEVRVITRRYDLGREKTLVLEFRQGVESRPVLRSGTKEEQGLVRDGGTCVKVCLSEERVEQIRSGKIFQYGENLEVSLARLAPCLDCNLFYQKTMLVRANDWQTMDPMALVNRVVAKIWEETGSAMYRERWPAYRSYFQRYCANMSPCYEGDTMCGRAFLFPGLLYISGLGTLISGGFQSGERAVFFGGVVPGRQTDVSRNLLYPSMSDVALRRWAETQRDLIVKMKSAGWEQVAAASLLSSLGVSPDDLFLAECMDGYLMYENIVDRVNRSKREFFVVFTVSLGDFDISLGDSHAKMIP